MGEFKLRFPIQDVHALAAHYEYPSEEKIECEVGPRARAAGYMVMEDLKTLCAWKTPRSKSKVARNDPAFVVEVTKASFSTSSERLRIEVLTLLRGVSWPTASVILHFAHRDPYPILDFRALWSLGVISNGQYDFDLWAAYTDCCRRLAKEAGVTMRVLDRALWQFSKENQPSIRKK